MNSGALGSSANSDRKYDAHDFFFSFLFSNPVQGRVRKRAGVCVIYYEIVHTRPRAQSGSNSSSPFCARASDIMWICVLYYMRVKTPGLRIQIIWISNSPNRHETNDEERNWKREKAKQICCFNFMFCGFVAAHVFNLFFVFIIFNVWLRQSRTWIHKEREKKEKIKNNVLLLLDFCFLRMPRIRFFLSSFSFFFFSSFMWQDAIR